MVVANSEQTAPPPPPPPMLLSECQIVEIAGCPRSAVKCTHFEHNTRCKCCPVARSGHRVFADANFVYMVGGYSPHESPNQTFQDVWRFNQLLECWEQCVVRLEGAHGINGGGGDAIPPTLASFSLVSGLINNEALFYGGTGVPFGATTSSQMHRIRLDRRTGAVIAQRQLSASALNRANSRRPSVEEDGDDQLMFDDDDDDDPAIVFGAGLRPQQNDGGDVAWPRIYGQGMIYALEQRESDCIVATDEDASQVKEVVYLVGGTEGHLYYMDVYRLERPLIINHTSSTSSHLNRRHIPWTCKKLNAPTQEQGRYRLEAVLHPNKKLIVTLGGGAPRFVAEFRELLVFDLVDNVWGHQTTRPDARHGFPLGRKCHAVVEWQGNVFVLGGSRDHQPLADDGQPRASPPNSTFEIFSDIWRLDMNNWQWAKLPTRLLSSVFFHSAFMTPDGCMYVFGGCTDSPSSSRSNRLQRIWLAPPPLRERAARALFRHRPDFRQSLFAQWQQRHHQPAVTTAPPSICSSAAAPGIGDEAPPLAPKMPADDAAASVSHHRNAPPAAPPAAAFIDEPGALARAAQQFFRACTAA